MLNISNITYTNATYRTPITLIIDTDSQFNIFTNQVTLRYLSCYIYLCNDIIYMSMCMHMNFLINMDIYVCFVYVYIVC